jgi:hypothetical protein
VAFIGSLNVWDLASYRQQSRDLESLAASDYSCLQRYIAARYPNTDGLDPRKIPFIEKYLDELAGRYARRVVRRFRGVDQTVWTALTETYRDSNIDAALAEAERQLWLQNFVLLVPEIVGPGQVHVHVIRPWQIVDIVSRDPARITDPRAWSRIEIEVPSAVVLGQAIMGQMVLTPTEATRTVGGDVRGMFGAGASHDFGAVPVVVLRRREPPVGRWAPAVNEAALDLQVALSLAIANDDLIIDHCAWPQKVLAGVDHTNQVIEAQIGPEKIVVLKSGGANGTAPTMGVVQGQVPVTELSNWLETQIRIYCSMLGISPDAFIKTNTSVTAAARLFSAAERKVKRDELVPVFERGETELGRIVAWARNKVSAVQIDRRALVVETTWQEPSPPIDPVQSATATEKRLTLGLDSVDEVVAAERGISVAQAGKLVDAALKRNRAAGVAAGGNAPAPAPMPPGAPEPGDQTASPPTEAP